MSKSRSLERLEGSTKTSRMNPNQANPRYTTDTLPSVLMSVVNSEVEQVRPFDSLFDEVMADGGTRNARMQQNQRASSFTTALQMISTSKNGDGLKTENSTHNRSREEALSFTELERQIKNDNEKTAKKLKNVAPLSLKVSSKKPEQPVQAAQQGKQEIIDELISSQDKIELLRIFMKYFRHVDPTASKHFVDSCLSMAETKGIKTVEDFLVDIYGKSPFDFKDEPESAQRVLPPTKFNGTQKRATATGKKKKKLLTVESYVKKVKDLIETDIANAVNNKDVKTALSNLFKLRHIIDKSFTLEDAKMDQIFAWSFKYGTVNLMGKLEIFYLLPLEQVIKVDMSVSMKFPDLPFHDSEDRARFEESLKRVKHEKVEEASKQPEKGAVIMNDKALDQSEIAHLWLCLFEFYQSNNYMKGVEIDLVRQTENSVYFVLQHGISEFNQKLKQKYGENVTYREFTLAQKNSAKDEATMAKVLKIYENANKSLRDAAKTSNKKYHRRTFEKLIDALNFKFSTVKKEEGEGAKFPSPIKRNSSFGLTGTRVGNFISSIGFGFTRGNKPKTTNEVKEEKNEDPIEMTEVDQEDEAESLFSRKIHLFLLQSMKTPKDKIPAEKERLVEYYRKNGFKALATHLRIFYGGSFEDIDYMRAEEVDEMLQQIIENHEVQKSQNPKNPVKQSAPDTQKNESFNNVYNDLSFYRNPEARMRYKKDI